MPIAPGVDLGEIASKAEGMTGADLKALLYSAQLQAAHETLTARQQSRENSLTESLDADVVTSTPDTSCRGSSIALVSTKRPLVFKFTEGGVRKSSQLSSSLESTVSGLLFRKLCTLWNAMHNYVHQCTICVCLINEPLYHIALMAYSLVASTCNSPSAPPPPYPGIGSAEERVVPQSSAETLHSDQRHR